MSIRSFFVDEEGQDLVEYALLTAFVALAGAGALSLIITAIGSSYSSWDSNSTGINSLWESPNP